MKNKVENLKVKGYEYTGYLFYDGQDHKIGGEFIVRFNGQYPSVEVESAYLLDSGNGVESKVDLKDLELRILDTDDGSWYDNHQDFLASRNRTMLGE